MVLHCCRSAVKNPHISKQNWNISLPGWASSSSGERDSSFTVILGDIFLCKSITCVLITGMRLDVQRRGWKCWLKVSDSSVCVERGGVSQKEHVVNSLDCHAVLFCFSSSRIAAMNMRQIYNWQHSRREQRSSLHGFSWGMFHFFDPIKEPLNYIGCHLQNPLHCKSI